MYYITFILYKTIKFLFLYTCTYVYVHIFIHIYADIKLLTVNMYFPFINLIIVHCRFQFFFLAILIYLNTGVHK